MIFVFFLFGSVRYHLQNVCSPRLIKSIIFLLLMQNIESLLNIVQKKLPGTQTQLRLPVYLAPILPRYFSI